MTDKNREAKQISLYTPRIKGRKLTPRQIKNLLKKIKSKNGQILKINVSPSTDRKEKGGPK